ncbi:ABC transporter permease [Actinocorallia populi]|uniref:ABC transporter permease n=1 Tax=Actinocorallia populi TaxID=2079200 RepID=UPI000D087B3E|nr:ABC transporter permease [Actinocorallia populi]
MTDVIASEWLKLRTLRSTFALLAAAAAVLVPAALISALMVADWDASPPEEQAVFASADPGVLVLPFAQFCLAALGALVITGEHATGMIRTSAVAVPDRRVLFLAKAAVTAAAAFAAGLSIALATLAAGSLITGDRPAPIASTATPADALLQGLLLATTALVGLGLGALIRATAGAFTALAALIFVLPSLVSFLPWDISPYLLPNLAALPALPAVAAMTAYAAAALTAGVAATLYRDI